jgi:hypothetical protein
MLQPPICPIRIASIAYLDQLELARWVLSQLSCVKMGVKKRAHRLASAPHMA